MDDLTEIDYLAESRAKKATAHVEVDVSGLINKLHTHQVELELQNDELKVSQGALQALSDRYKQLYDHAPVGYFVTDARCIILDANQTLRTMLDRSNIVGSPLSSIVFSEDQGTLYLNVGDILTRVKHSFSLRLDTMPGPMWVRIDISTERDESDTLIQVRGTVTDISALKQSEAERHNIEKSKSKALGILAGGIAHDFNNLMIIVSGNAELIEQRKRAGTAFEPQLKAIQMASDSAVALCKQMLTYAGRSIFETRVVDLNEIVGDVVRFTESSISAVANMELNLDADLPMIKAESSQLTQIIMNLVINASDSLGGDVGIITVKTFATFGECPLICLEVSDNGCGMDAETRERIFEPFFTSKLTGRGMGMSAVLGIVNSLNAIIQVQSTPGEGSTIRVHFPVSQSQVPISVFEPEEPDIKRNGLILVVDDQAPIRDLYEEILNTAGYRTILACDGLEAVKIYIARGHEIDAIFMDLIMPVMKGDKAIKIIRSRDPEVPIFLASGCIEDSPDLRSEMYTGFIQKPCSPSELISALDSVLCEVPSSLASQTLD